MFFQNELFLRLSINLVVNIIIIYFIYFKANRKRSFVFTYALISVNVFFLCYMLSNIELQLGFALGLFAIFGIIRYRTDTIPIREMTYLFLIITLSTINALYSITENMEDIIIVNLSLVLVTWVAERLWMTNKYTRKSIVYDKLENIRPEREEELKKDIFIRTGIQVINFKVGHIDFPKQSVKLTLFYNKEDKLV